ncbi:uncharacterized protein EAE97_005829 [Botrytis byssoidea]|uniref:Uncharacterized protein n=1 Tax=Botrytis byssoidea TaxID=139641 RepID=A0A9P5IQZ5_9HELO|nr:uncharacterized protein EAE97_005829 [Botrytis byssoidea]KAF7943759.1 hypothetical protein EAE97_005829 [Botrytis byssoidea]
MVDVTDAPKNLDAERSPLSPPSNLEAIDLSDKILSPISNILNDRNMQRSHFPGTCPAIRRSESSKIAENTLNSAGELSLPRLKKEFHPLEKNKNRSSKSSPPSPNLSSHNINSTAPSFAEKKSDSVSQTPSEHSSGSDAAFYCNVGSLSEDEEDGLNNSLDRRAEIGGEGEPGLAKRTLQETVPTSGTGIATDGGGKREEDDDDDDEEEDEEESSGTHKKNDKRRKSKKRYTFLKRIFGRKKARDSDGGAAGSS